MVSCKLHLFGGPRLVLEGRLLGLSPTQETLLGILGLHGGEGLRRSALKELLWARGTDAQVSQRLTQLLYMTRKRLGAAAPVLVPDDPVRLAPDHVRTDLDEFHAALRDGHLEEAWGFLRQRLLAGLTGEVTPALERHLVAVEEGLRHALSLACAGAWDEALRSADWTGALRAASVLSHLDPGEEEYLRRRLFALSSLGRVAEARAICELFRQQRRRRGRSWVPSESTAELLRNLPNVAREQAKGVFERSGSPLEPGVLVGRDRELQALQSLLLQRVQDGEVPPAGTSLLVLGPEGIGKTRLIKEALRPALTGGLRLLTSACRPLEIDTPLYPLVRALAGSDAPAALVRIPEPWRSFVVDFMPELAADAGGAGGAPRRPPPRPGSASTKPHQLVEAFLRLLGAMADDCPTLLWIDDLHWADRLTLRVLGELTRRGGGEYITLVLSLRTPGVHAEGDAPIARFLAKPGESVRRLSLLPLDRGSIEALMRSVNFGPIDPELVETIHAASGGNPQLALLALGSHHPDHEPGRTPDGIRRDLGRLIERRLETLDPEQRTILFVLATLRSPLSLAALAHGLDRSGPDLASGLNELTRFGWVLPSGSGEFTCREPLEAVIARLAPEGDRLLWHRRFGEWLTAQGDHPSRCLAARHFLTSGDRARAVAVAGEAAREALDRGTSEALAPLVDQLAGELPPSRQAWEMHDLAGRLHFQGGAPERAVHAFDRAHRQALALGEKRNAVLPLLVRRLCAAAWLTDGSVGSLLEEVWALHRECLDHEELAHAATLLDVALRLATEEGDGSAFRRGVDLAGRLLRQRELRPAERVAFLLIRAAELVWGTSAEGSAAVDEALELARTRADPTLRARAVNWRIIQLYHEGALNLPAGIRARTEAEDTISETGDLQLRFRLPLNLAVWYLDTLDLGAGRIALDRAAKVIEGRDAPKLHRQLAFNQGELLLQEGEYEAAGSAFRTCLERFPGGSRHPMRGIAECGLAVALARSGNRRAAREVMDRLRGTPDSWMGDRSLFYRARLETSPRSDVPAILRELDGALAEARLRSLPWTLRLAVLGNAWRGRSGAEVNRTQIERTLGDIDPLNLGTVGARLRSYLPEPGTRR